MEVVVVTSDNLYHHALKDRRDKTKFKVQIANSSTTIPYQAFYGCELTSIDIPNSITYIGHGAFRQCLELTSVDIPTSVTSIEDGAFRDCVELLSVNIPYSLTAIGAAVFHCCTELTSIDIPNSIVSIGELAFSKCKRLTSINLPNSVISIGPMSFFECKGLTSVTISNATTSIQANTFQRCSNLTSITLPKSVTLIGCKAFDGCKALISIEIPNSVTTIERDAFHGCLGLISVEIPDSVTSTHDIFRGCKTLRFVVAPPHMVHTPARDSLFRNCPQLLTNNIVLSTPATRLRVLQEQFWSIATHSYLSSTQRNVVLTVMFCAERLECAAPPFEMWIYIFQHLRPVHIW